MSSAGGQQRENPADVLFAALDTDGDGVITRTEMREGFAGGNSGSGGGGAFGGRLGAAERSALRGSAVGDSASQWSVSPVVCSAVWGPFTTDA